jgi:N-acyl-D-amino-acid deacylase
MVYMPCIFSRHDEWVRVFSRAASHGGFLVVHMRNASSLLLESLDELFRISDEARISLHVSHFKAAGKRNWHKMTDALRMMERRSTSDESVSFDIYPYTAGSTMFSNLLPPWTLEGGMPATLERLKNPQVREAIIRAWESPPPPSMNDRGWDNPVFLVGWENIMVSSARSGNPATVGRRIDRIAADRGISPAQAVFNLMKEEQGDMGIIIFSMDEERVAEGIKHPLATICTDGLLGGKPHPRVYGSCPRVLARHVRERRDLTLEQAIHHMTGKPAARIGLKDRGLLRTGMAADIVVFSPKEVQDTGTFEDPRQFPRGISHVMVNGAHSVDKGVYTNQLGGRLLRRE